MGEMILLKFTCIYQLPTFIAQKSYLGRYKYHKSTRSIETCQLKIVRFISISIDIWMLCSGRGSTGAVILASAIYVLSVLTRALSTSDRGCYLYFYLGEV